MGILIQYMLYSISITVASWVVGMALNSLFKQTNYYKAYSNIILIRSSFVQRLIKLSYFKWIVKNTFFKHLTPKLNLKINAGIKELKNLRDEMVFTELNHLVGFCFVSLLVVMMFIERMYLFSSIDICIRTFI